MPIIFINMTEGRDDIKGEIAKNVTKAMCDTMQLGPEHMTVVFNDIPYGSLAFGGNIVNKKPE